VTDDEYPRLLDGIAFIPLRDGYLAEGASARKTFTGRVPVVLFGSLLPLLDGRLSTAEIAGKLGVSAEVADAVVGLLRREGLIRTWPRPVSAGRDPSPARVYLRRTYGWSAGDAIWRRSRRSAVTVRGDTQVADLISALLEQSGVETVTMSPARLPAGDRPVLEVLTGTAVARPGTAALPVRRGPGGYTIGPVSGTPGAACPQCAAVPGDASVAGATESSALLATAAAAAAGAILRLVGDYGSSRVRNQVIEIPLPDAVPRTRSVMPGPSCECGREAAAPCWQAADLNPLAGPAGAMTSRPVKHYLTEPRKPAAAVAGSDVAWLLATLAAAPRRGGSPWPTAAACPGSTRTYLCLPDASAYYYDGRSRELVQVAGPVPGREHGNAAAGREPARLVLTSDLAAMRPVFGRQGGQWLLQQDAGLALARLAYCASAAGRRVRAVPGAVGALAATLDTDPGREPVAAVAALALAPAGDRRVLGQRTVSRQLKLIRQTYDFAGERVDADTLQWIKSDTLARVNAIWQRDEWPDFHIDSLIFERSGDNGRPVEIDAYLEDRGITSADVLIFTGRTRTGDLSDYQSVVSRTAAAAGLAQFAAARKGLQSGLLARLPEGVLAVVRPAQMPGSVAYGCVIGHAAATSRGTRIVTW
jgi:hypothetical protein